eukprot:5730436-Pleurochrysis_carterae.AAC.3
MNLAVTSVNRRTRSQARRLHLSSERRSVSCISKNPNKITPDQRRQAAPKRPAALSTHASTSAELGHLGNGPFQETSTRGSFARGVSRPRALVERLQHGPVLTACTEKSTLLMSVGGENSTGDVEPKLLLRLCDAKAPFALQGSAGSVRSRSVTFFPGSR